MKYGVGQGTAGRTRAGNGAIFCHPGIIGGIAAGLGQLSATGADTVGFRDGVLGVASQHPRRLLRGGVDQRLQRGEIFFRQGEVAAWAVLRMDGRRKAGGEKCDGEEADLAVHQMVCDK